MLDEWRRTDAAFFAVEGDITDEVADPYYEARSVVMRTRPTTLAGLAALTAWTRDLADGLLANGSEMYGEDLCALTASIADASAVLCGDTGMLEAVLESAASMRKPARRKAVA